MDIICLDQRNQNEVIASARKTPAIFRDAKKTLAIRAGDGFYDCCAAAIQDANTFAEIWKLLGPHVSSTHWRVKFQESYMRRLWTLQEMIWSKNLQFVCDDQGQ